MATQRNRPLDSILMSAYFDELTRAMTWLGQQPSTLFVGQQTRYPGQRMHASLAGVPMEKRIEMPVAENFQMGFCTGLALEGYVPICSFPRWDFAIIAADQLVNHLDKIPLVSDYRPKVIIRTAVGSDRPLNPGPQHTQNHSDAVRLMLKTIPVVELTRADGVLSGYEWAWKQEGPVIMVEYMGAY